MSNCKVIALTNQKGGVGKTTTAVNLGVSLVQQGKKVLLIDADAQANLTMALGYNRPDDIPITLSTVMHNIIDDKTLDVSQGIIHHSEGVDLLPSNIELSGFEVRLINAMSRERVLKTYVNEVKKNYDYVLIDCMPSLGMITINALAAADSVIIPTQPHYLSAKGLELLLRSVSMVKRQINPKLRIDGILMTMVMPRTNISKEITATVKSAYGQKIKVFDTEIPHPKDKDFYEEHKTIHFDTLTEQAEYEIVAVFKTVAYSSEGFRYYDFVNAEDEEGFNTYIAKCKDLALYDTGVSAEYGDKLITLSTCEYSAQNGRLVVVAKKVG